jgi:hypothetical protein
VADLSIAVLPSLNPWLGEASPPEFGEHTREIRISHRSNDQTPVGCDHVAQ